MLLSYLKPTLYTPSICGLREEHTPDREGSNEGFGDTVSDKIS